MQPKATDPFPETPAVSEGIARRAGAVKGKQSPEEIRCGAVVQFALHASPMGLITLLQIFSHTKSYGSREAAPSFQLFLVCAGQIPAWIAPAFPCPSILCHCY